jgi:hypothetical protein
MAENETSKSGCTAGGTELHTSSPTGHEELEEQSVAELQGCHAPPPIRERKANPALHTMDTPQNRNPKHTARKPNSEDEIKG